MANGPARRDGGEGSSRAVPQVSFGIDEGIADVRRRLKALIHIKEHYPDAVLRKLPNGDEEWTTQEINPVSVLVVVNAKGEAFFCPYEIVGIGEAEMKVFSWRNEEAKYVISELPEEVQLAIAEACTCG